MSDPTDDIDRLKRIRDAAFYMRSANGAAHLASKYKLTRRDVCKMLIEQKGLCGCCGVDLDGLKWAIDHNHNTGNVRSILCYGCNTGLGKLGGDIAGLQKALAYLQRCGET